MQKEEKKIQLTYNYQQDGKKISRTIEYPLKKNPDEILEVNGEPGSLLALAMQSQIPIEHACGGSCACATCHVFVKQGLESCNALSEEENDQLEKAPGFSFQSRLACQCIPTGTEDLVIEVPDWNRNI